MEERTVVIIKPSVDAKLGINLRLHLDQTIRIVSLTPGGLGEASGLLKEGDQIISVNGTSVNTDVDAINIVRNALAEVTLRLLRPLIVPANSDHTTAAAATTPASSIRPAGACAASPTDASLAREVADSAPKVLDFYKYLQGHWKRNLQCREFGGGFRHMHSSNTLVCIEPDDIGDSSSLSLRSLRWKFGNVSAGASFSPPFASWCRHHPSHQSAFVVAAASQRISALQ